MLSERIGYITGEQSSSLQTKAEKLQMMISGFIRHLEDGGSSPIVN
jgi:hypothetical protein